MKALALVSLVLLAGCISSKSDSGVLNTWRSRAVLAFERGTTTQADVARALGPPSQLIDLGNQVIFYYLREQSRSKGFILIVYNETKTQITYDRAIFFFDKQGVLQEYALSIEEMEYAPPPEPKTRPAAED